MKDLLLQAGTQSLFYYDKIKDLVVSEKGGTPRDLVSEADLAVEKELFSRIKSKYPEHGILGEEQGEMIGSSQKTRWIIDPIDGTTNFLYGQPFFCTSIALQVEGEIVLGGVYAPCLKELFLAEKGKGATLNGKPIQTTACKNLKEALLATGFACMREEKGLNNIPILSSLLPQIRDIRRTGSAALDLCYVACGRVDGFWEMGLNSYDCAAGVLVIEEAGGAWGNFAGEKTQTFKEICAGGKKLFPQLAKELKNLHNKFKSVG